MKKVSAKVFFTVVWSGVCQALGWFFGLFGYKRDGKFAKCVWGLFATSVSFIVAVFAMVILYHIGEEVYNRYFKPHYCNEYCDYAEYICHDIYFHNTEDGKGYIYNKRTGEKLIKNIAWIARPLGRDSLVCFSNGKKRGYFSKNTGKVILEPKYNHAWIFSEGLAGIEEDGYIKFIDATGKVVIDKKMPYEQDMVACVFHGDYCVVGTDDGEHCGLIDKTGKMVLPKEYSYISPSYDSKLWYISKDGMNGLLDNDLKPMIPLMECSVSISDRMITVTMPDHTICKYDLQGKLIDDFYIVNVRMLEYEKDEIVYIKNNSNVDDDETEEENEYYHPKGTARMRAYVAGDGYEGLMTAEGQTVTMPLYRDIEAIGYDLYLCEINNCEHVIINGRGETITKTLTKTKTNFAE